MIYLVKICRMQVLIQILMLEFQVKRFSGIFSVRNIILGFMCQRMAIVKFAQRPHL